MKARLCIRILAVLLSVVFLSIFSTTASVNSDNGQLAKKKPILKERIKAPTTAPVQLQPMRTPPPVPLDRIPAWLPLTVLL